MPKPRNDILQGTLALLVLKTLDAQGQMHGYAITAHIQRVSSDLLRVEEGSLYPALHRMEHRGLIAADWRLTENKRRAKYYILTTKGRQQLRARVSTWDRYARAVSQVVHATVQPS